jgi:hypothetical protein
MLASVQSRAHFRLFVMALGTNYSSITWLQHTCTLRFEPPSDPLHRIYEPLLDKYTLHGMRYEVGALVSSSLRCSNRGSSTYVYLLSGTRLEQPEARGRYQDLAILRR